MKVVADFFMPPVWNIFPGGGRAKLYEICTNRVRLPNLSEKCSFVKKCHPDWQSPGVFYMPIFQQLLKIIVLMEAYPVYLRPKQVL
jgi:hypothetical protein